jgi:hypothetical protein
MREAMTDEQLISAAHRSYVAMGFRTVTRNAGFTYPGGPPK